MPPPRKPLPVVGEAAAASPGTGTDTTPSSDWLGEIISKPEPDPKDGVPVSTRKKGERRRGQAVESKRGQQQG